MAKSVDDPAATAGPPALERPSGLAYAGFTLGIVGIVLPGVPLVALPLSGVALHRDPRAGRRRWAAGWGLGLSALGLVTQMGLILEVLGV